MVSNARDVGDTVSGPIRRTLRSRIVAAALKSRSYDALHTCAMLDTFSYRFDPADFDFGSAYNTGTDIHLTAAPAVPWPPCLFDHFVSICLRDLSRPIVLNPPGLRRLLHL